MRRSERGLLAAFAALRFDNRSLVIVEVGEDAVQMMEQLVFKNVSEQIFDPGPDGLLVRVGWPSRLIQKA